MLSKLELRKESLPFDWLDTKSHLALNFAFETIQSEFNFFLSDLDKNDQGKVYSQKHPEALFYHFDDLIENKNFQKKIEKRTQRFLELQRNNACCFLHTVTSQSIEEVSNLQFIIKSVGKFSSLLKPNDELLIYLRFDESLKENSHHAQLLDKAIQSYPQVKMISYVRQKNTFGIWGDETNYKELVNDIGIQTKIGFPKIKLIRKK
jgi:GTPase involved in cell partitioning and DNA repair